MKLTKQKIPFTQVANEVLNDENISYKAKGLFAYLFSKPDTWQFSYKRMITISDGKKSILSALRELESRGYLIRKKLFTGRILYDLKYSYKPSTQKGYLVINTPGAEKGYLPKRLLAKKGTISNKEGESNKERESNIRVSDNKNLSFSYKKMRGDFIRKTEFQ